MKNFSIWTEYYENKEKKTLNQDDEYDITIIGGGITGLSSAYQFINDNKRVCILEKNLIAESVTARSTAKISYMQESVYSEIEKIRGYDSAKLYYESQKESINNILSIIKNHNIECDLEETDSYLFAQNNQQMKKIKKEKELLESFNEELEEVETLPDGLKVKYGIKVHKTYVFNPIKYLNGLRSIIEKTIPIYENSCVTKIKKENNYYCLKVNNFNIKSKIIILCTHYPYFLFPYLMPLKCSLEKSYISLFKVPRNLHFQAITSQKPTLSIRYIENDNKCYKLVLTNSKNLAFSQNDLNNFLSLYNSKPDYLWSNIDIITKDYLPYIGKIDNNFYLSTGFNTWGMTNSMLSANIIYDLISNIDNKYENLVSPKRYNILNEVIKYPLYLINNTYSFVNSKIIKNKSWYSNQVKFKKVDGVSVGIYQDQFGKEHIVKNKCPHLGCSLIFNEIEQTWDCPCHGSRFNIDGYSISGPSNYDITFKGTKKN